MNSYMTCYFGFILAKQRPYRSGKGLGSQHGGQCKYKSINVDIDKRVILIIGSRSIIKGVYAQRGMHLHHYTNFQNEPNSKLVDY